MRVGTLEQKARYLIEMLVTMEGETGSDIDPTLAGEVLACAEKLCREATSTSMDPHTWHHYLNVTGRSPYLRALGDRPSRERWAETAFRAIDLGVYSLEDLLRDRASAHPQRSLFLSFQAGQTSSWSYPLVVSRLRNIAALFRRTAAGNPRVAILSENCVDGACCDLACLVHDIFVTPLSVHFDDATVAWLFDRVDINMVVTDCAERYRRLEHIRKLARNPFAIFLMDAGASAISPREGDFVLDEACSMLGHDEVGQGLKREAPRNLHEVCSVMFTSGSSGQPKGVAFTHFSLITKRFARAAALPGVGDREVLLCYLPLFHTFGRYLEMLGSVYWGGTYVFTGNPSAETLLAQLPRVQPTGLIGIPLRWEQIRDECLRRMSEMGGAFTSNQVFREMAGPRLRWGLSAAGFLHPQVFRFFQRNGVELCSGFGMTEATGGVTMTPPGEYVDGSVGIPLPGVKVRLGEHQELQVSGPYIVRYLDDIQAAACDGPQAQPARDDQPYWLATGDLFKELQDGHLQIVDRIKDIYKNNRGQTISPLRVEGKLTGAPGVKHAFLVGDGREYNVLLIVPDRSDPILQDPEIAADLEAYFHQLVMAANRDLAPYERVVNLAILDRAFDLNQGELTPKGTFRRKNIERNFAAVIERLYQRPYVQRVCNGCTVHIPRWHLREGGILEGDLCVGEEGLLNLQTNRRLKVCRGAEGDTYRIGDLEYRTSDPAIDLDLLSRQPALWMGNPELTNFCPCKDGWDIPLGRFSDQVLLPRRSASSVPVAEPGSTRLGEVAKGVDMRMVEMLFGDEDKAVKAIGALEKHLESQDERLTRVIRRRLEALAYHPVEALRCLAYRILLLDEPALDYGHLLPTFLYSGLPFLNEDSIAHIAQQNIGMRRLEALRQRLHTYRSHLEWPASEAVRRQFEAIFKLLVNHVKHAPEFYSAVRAELACWKLHTLDPQLAEIAKSYFYEVAAWFEAKLDAETPKISASLWREKIEIGDEIGKSEIHKIEATIIGTTFLKQAIMLAYDLKDFALEDVASHGIWISRLLTQAKVNLYRVTINLKSGTHYELILVLRGDVGKESVIPTCHWTIALAGHPVGLPILPHFGCFRPKLGAMAMVYVNDLTVWDRIRAMSSRHHTFHCSFSRALEFRKLFMRALTAFFTGWRNSNYRIIPGSLSLDNVTVSQPDFAEGAFILSLTGWKHYKSPLSLVRPIIRNCFQKTAAYYPWTATLMDKEWIFDACIETAGMTHAKHFLRELKDELKPLKNPSDADLSDRVMRFLEKIERQYHPSQPLRYAIEHFRAWEKANPNAEPKAKEQQVFEAYQHFGLERHPEIARYYLFRHTYFEHASEPVTNAYDRLLDVMFQQPDTRPATLIELYDLQATLQCQPDHEAFRRLVFPRDQEPSRLNLVVVGDRSDQEIVLHSRIADGHAASYSVRPPSEASEIGQAIRLFVREKVAGTFSENDRYLIVIDDEERIVGSLRYRVQHGATAYLDVIVIASPFRRRGLGSAFLEDLCLRLQSQGVRVLALRFLPRAFFRRRGFDTNRRWSGLVRFLGPDSVDDGS